MIEIKGKIIDFGRQPFIIAEIGKNFIQSEEDKPWQEYLDNARELVSEAKKAGADAVKFQTHRVEDEQLDIDVTSPHFNGSDRYSWVTRNTKATPDEFWRELKKFCDEQGIIFFSTPMSRKSAELLESLGVELWKVGSGDILDFVTLDYIAQTKKPIIISSGMSTLEELDKAVKFLQGRGAEVAVTHCVSKYPCPPEELNLGTIEFLHERYGIPVGFSDHSLGDDSAVAAAGMGAAIIEKHFSLDRNLFGADHKVSMLPEEFKQMVEKIRSGEKANVENYGSKAKVLNEDEAVFRPLFRKSLMAGRDIKAGETLQAEDVFAMRPQLHAGGLPSEEYEKVLGKTINKDLNKYNPITWEILE